MKQWHPLFARLLRPLVESHFDVQTDLPVGDVPRQADLVLVRRTRAGPLPFRGLWRDLTTWNVLEFKGPTVSPRLRDLDLLIELGLGVDRRLNEERARQRQQPLTPQEVSFWYLANRLGRRFLRDAGPRLGLLERHAEGVWRGTVLQRPVFLVSTVGLPVEEDALPLHVLGREPPEIKLSVARFVAEQPRLWRRYAEWLLAFNEEIRKEILAMARTSRKGPEFDLAWIFRDPQVRELLGEEKFKRLGESFIEAFGPEEILKAAGPEQVLKAVGGPEQVLKAVGGPEQVVRQLGVDGILAGLSPRDRQELKRRLAEEPEGRRK
jgi:hypothetical protein